MHLIYHIEYFTALISFVFMFMLECQIPAAMPRAGAYSCKLN